MYLDYYQMSDEPFRVTPDPSFLYLAEQYREALAAIVYGITARKGFVCITGEVGVGKTTILRSYLESSDRKGMRFVYVFNPNLGFPTLVRMILRELGLPFDKEEPVTQLVERLHEELIRAWRAGETVVLFIDEAHNMPVETLESMRMLSNLETTTDKLLQIVLVGQPELEAKLASHELRQLNSRIAVRAKLGPLTRKDSLAYVRHRLHRVALDSRPVFTDKALDMLVTEARGIPRTINILCDNALITGFGYQKRPVGPAIVREVIADSQGRHPHLGWPAVTAATLVALLGAGTAYVSLFGMPFDPRNPARVTDSLPRTAPADPGPQIAMADGGPEWAADLLQRLTIDQADGPANAPQPDPEPEPAPAPVASPPSQPVVVAAKPPPAEPVPVRTVARIQLPAAGGAKGDMLGRVVVPGDTLLGLIRDVYGEADPRLIDRVMTSNPGISNPNLLYVGQVVMFPQSQPALPPASPQ